MRTTVDINDELLQAAKKQAAERNETLREVIDGALRRHFHAPAQREGFRLRWRAHKRGKLQPGVVLEDRDALFNLMEGRD